MLANSLASRIDANWRQIAKMASEQIASMEPTVEATSEFLEHAALWHKRTVFMESCNSWWKASTSGQ